MAGEAVAELGKLFSTAQKVASTTGGGFQAALPAPRITAPSSPQIDAASTKTTSRASPADLKEPRVIFMPTTGSMQASQDKGSHPSFSASTRGQTQGETRHRHEGHAPPANTQSPQDHTDATSHLIALRPTLLLSPQGCLTTMARRRHWAHLWDVSCKKSMHLK